MERIGPYRIVEKIGTGGMGEVFKAFDDRLDRWVAIKRIRPGKELDENRRRFRREARATARLNHASIVHVYDIFKDGDSDCIVMEYVEGRTLQSITAESHLDPMRIAELGMQIAEGLAEAHSKGILHRDLKTENIIVTTDGQAKILDFGLAKPLFDDTDPGLTGKGQLVGTSRTMSPEYVSGEKVDHRADLFSFGVLLYEGSTGRSPFKARNTLATLKQVIIHHPPPPRELNGQIPVELSDLIERLLEKSPGDRPQSARDVAEELRRISGASSSGSVAEPSSTELALPAGEVRSWKRLTPLPRALANDSRMRSVAISVALAMLAAVVVGAYFLGRRGAAGNDFVFEKTDKIVLGSFDNRTGEPLLDESLELAFRVGLEQSQFAHVMPPLEIRSALSRMQRDPGTAVDRDLGIEICQRENARALVIGSIVKVGASYSLSAEVVDPRSGLSVFTAPASKAVDRGEILAALDRVSQAVRTHLGESLAAIEDREKPLEKVTTKDLEALQAYSLGVTRLTEDRLDEAEQLFARALDLDPDFAMAWAKLGVLHHSRNSPKALGCFQHALRLSDRLTEFERLYVEGWVANLKDTPQDMIRIWSLVGTLYPERDESYYNLGVVSWLYYNRVAEAAERFERAAERQPPEGRRQTLRFLGFCQLASNAYNEAITSFRRTRPPVDLADTYIAAERYPAAQIFLQELEGPDVLSRFDLLEVKGLLRVDAGRFREAVELLGDPGPREGGARRPKEELTRLLALSAVLARSGETAELSGVLRQAIRLAREIRAVGSESFATAPVPALAVLGKIAVRSGEIDLARDILSEVGPLAGSAGIELWTSYAAVLEGEILLAEGRAAEAVERLRTAVELVDPFQAHDSLARAYEEAGDLEGALAESTWMVEHRGRPFAECRWVCGVRTPNVVDWTDALWRQGRLREETGDRAGAIEAYDRLVRRWQDGDRPEPWVEARERLRRLRPDG